MTEEKNEIYQTQKEFIIAKEWSNKQEALNILTDALKLQKMYLLMKLDEKGEMVTVTDMMSQAQKKINVWGDNIRAMLTDVLKGISDWN